MPKHVVHDVASVHDVQVDLDDVVRAHAYESGHVGDVGDGVDDDGGEGDGDISVNVRPHDTAWTLTSTVGRAG